MVGNGTRCETLRLLSSGGGTGRLGPPERELPTGSVGRAGLVFPSPLIILFFSRFYGLPVLLWKIFEAIVKFPLRSLTLAHILFDWQSNGLHPHLGLKGAPFSAVPFILHTHTMSPQCSLSHCHITYIPLFFHAATLLFKAIFSSLISWTIYTLAPGT